MKENEISRADVTHGEKKNSYKPFVANPEERGHLQDLGVNGNSVLKGTSRTGVGVEWMQLAQNRNKWAFLNIIISPPML
jgi:hypothetical protein